MRLRFLALALLAACASAPIPNPAAWMLSSSKGDKPAWVSTPNGDLRFPPDRFVAQVGSATVGARQAPELLAAVDAAARAAVVAELGRISPQLVQDLDPASAIEIQGRWRAGDTAYAWALFDKQKALALQQGKVEGHAKSAKELLAQGAAAEVRQPADALRAYARARTEGAAAANGAPLVQALGGTIEQGDTQAEAESNVRALLGELTLTVVDGDSQRVAEGKGLAKPIVFTAWLKGKRAVGLPVAVAVGNGGRATGAVVGPEGKAEVRVEDIGKFSGTEQRIQIAVDWAGLLGVAPEKVPEWIGALPRAGVAAVALKKGVSTTRVLVLVSGKSEKLTSTLKAAGFDVQDGQALLDKFGAQRISSMTDAQLRDAAKRVADVVVIGGATGLRAIEVGSGTVVFNALGEALGPNLGAALKKAAEQ